jgi:hypothetical protein
MEDEEEGDAGGSGYGCIAPQSARLWSRLRLLEALK